jgi:membrane dipeptidase
VFDRRTVLVNGAALALAAPAQAQGFATIHRRLLCLDTHLDAPANFGRTGWDIMDRHGGAVDATQLDYPRMVEGGLDGGFFAIYTPQGPDTPEGHLAMRDAAFQRAAEIREMVAANPERFELAFTPEDALRIAAAGKRIVYQSIENSAVLGTDVSLLRVFYRLGVRMAGPVHFRNNQLGDSATDTRKWNGLSPLGRDFVTLCNDLGIVIDQSHASDDVFDQLMELSRAPIICSHSGCRSVHDHPRNLDDARIRRLAAAGSTLQINSYNEYLVTVPPNPDRQRAIAALRAANRPAEGAGAREVAAAMRRQTAAMKEIDAKFPIPRASFEDFMQHTLHALDLVGPDHVGVGPDWDGGGGVTGMEDVASLPRITERLLKLGYTEAQLGQFWGGNVLRVLGAAQKARKIT